MSYDLDLFTPQKGIDPITTIQQAALRRESAKHKLNHRTVKALEQDNPEFHVQESQAAIDIVEQQHGLKISLYHNGGHLSIPYWHTDDQALRLVFWHVRRYLRVIQKQTGYAVYDPQLGHVVDIEKDMSRMMETYRRAINSMQSLYGDI